MNLRSFKTLNYETFSNEVRKCLSPYTKKISSYYINKTINKIKSNLRLYNQTISAYRNKNLEIIENNSRFKKYMDKYCSYKKYMKEKDKHKIKKKLKGTIDILMNEYIKKGYKKPNLEKNIFHVNPLNNTGKIIQNYFDEYIRNKKKFVNSKEKNFYYLNKLKDCIKTQKFKDNDNILSELNLSTPNNTNIKEKEHNLGNLVIKKYFKNNININQQQCLSENDREKNNKNYEIDKDENFLKLNEYEQNNIRQLIKEYKDIKKYKSFIDKALKDKKYFNTIDNDDIDISKKKEIKTLNSPRNKNKKILKLKLDNNNINENSEDYEENNELSRININEKKTKIIIKNGKIKKENIFRKKNLSKKLCLTIYNNNSNFQQFNFSNKKNNYIGLNKKNFSEKDLSLNTKIENRKNSFSKRKENYKNILHEINREKKIKRTEVFKENNFLKNYLNQKLSKPSKEKSLNYLFNNLNKVGNPDQQYIDEYKNYFSKHKNMSESDLNEYIKRSYEPKDFYNLVSTVDEKIKNANIEDKWRKNYSKIGRVEARKRLLDEEKKQDVYINHLLQNFILSKYGIIKLYEFQ